MLPYPRPRAARRPVTSLALIIALTLAAALLAGCSGSKKDEPVLLATVGTAEIRGDYYENRLSKLEESELPKDDAGQPLDMSQQEGKSEFLTTLINKAIMEQKGRQLGYASEPYIAGAREKILAYEAGVALWASVIGEPAAFLSDAEVDEIYSRLGEIRRIEYIMCDFKTDADAALAELAAGATMDDVADKYFARGADSRKPGTLDVPWGRMVPEFESAVYDTPVGELAPPILNEYGWWVFRVVQTKQVDKPAKEDALARILDVTRSRKIYRLRQDFLVEVRAKYKAVIHDDALVVVFDALRPKEIMVDPQTRQPIPQDQLKSLEIADKDYDLPFFSYDINGAVTSYTVGEFKEMFDKMNTFQRPKRESLLEGLRNFIRREMDLALIEAESKERGLYEDQDVVAKVEDRVNQMIVSAMYDELVTIDERVTREDAEAFWADHAAEYKLPEDRAGKAVIAQDEALALEALAMVRGGAAWEDVVAKYDTDPGNTKGQGNLRSVPANATGPIVDAMFALEKGALSEPFPLGDGRFAIVRLDAVTPGRQPTLDESMDKVGKRIKSIRREDKFQELLAAWGAEIGVVRHDENLASMKSWKELTYVEPSGPEVPRR